MHIHRLIFIHKINDLFICRCSSGFDRNRQDWVDLGCQEEVVSCNPNPNQSIYLHGLILLMFFFFFPHFQRRDSHCLHTAGSTNTTSQQLLHTTTAVTTTTQQRGSGRASTLIKTPATANRSTQSKTNRRTAATPQPATSKPTGGEINKLSSNHLHTKTTLFQYVC